MDGSRFDRLLRLLATTPSRRSAFRLVAAPILGGFVARDVLPTEGKKKKKITLCHAGQTITVSKKKKKTHLKHGDTLGVCPDPPPPPPSGTTTMPPPPCQGQADDAACNGDGKCLKGGCNPKPDCKAGGEPCSGNLNCCSEACAGGLCSSQGFALVGEPCQVNGDCSSRRCVGYRCQCALGQRLCGNGFCGSCCSDGECGGGKRCLVQSDFTYGCRCPFGPDCGGVCVGADCTDKCFAQCTPGQPCCNGLTCREEGGTGSGVYSCQP